MSEEINNRKYRKQVIRDLLLQLHRGKSVDEVRAQFAAAFDGVTASEISEAEQELISEGLPAGEIQRLCDVHAAVFKGSIEDIHRPVPASEVPGHPVHTLKEENRALEALAEQQIRPLLQALRQRPPGAQEALTESLALLRRVDAHYLKKENLLFPYLEKAGITAPPKVMWGVDDEIRDALRGVHEAAAQTPGQEGLADRIESAVTKLLDMIFKEENILFPMLLETLSETDWEKIASEFGDLGWCLIDPPPPMQKASGPEPADIQPPAAFGEVVLPTGTLSVAQLAGLLDTLPVDITFVDRDDNVRYFSQNAERVFPRTRAIIGRNVTNCHPPASVHIVESILNDFKSGQKDHEDFWIHMGPKYILIRYYAVRDGKGEYLGTLEVTQEIAPIQKLDGEKRLLSK